MPLSAPISGLGLRFARSRWWIPVASTLLLYLLADGLAQWLFEIRIVRSRMLWDGGLLLAFSWFLFLASRRVWIFLAIQTLLVAALWIGNPLKIALLGRPMMPDDMDSFPALIEVLGPLGWVALCLPLAILGGLILANLTWRGLGAKLGLAGLALLFAIPVLAPAPLVAAMDERFGNTTWDQRENYVWRGAALHSLQEIARELASRHPGPPRAEALAAATLRLAQPWFGNLAVPAKPRNIYVMVLESFWDPSLLTKAGYSEPPFDPRFEALWELAGKSTALSPAFGGQTANAEFEFLCGFPVHDFTVKFESGFDNDLPCLPQVLGQLGYRTVASHPNGPGFWNRQNAYRHAGFEKFWSVKDFDLDDLTGPFLSDRSLYRQVAARLDRERDDRPTLSYVMTYYGHWSYDLGETHPAVLTAQSPNELVQRYGSVIRHKSRELADEIERITAADPEAIVIAFGDHLPTLGAKFGGYVESGLLADRFGDFTADQYGVSDATPLLVIDGKRGPLHVGSVPMFELPRLVMDLVGNSQKTLFDLSRTPGDRLYRPLPEATLVYRGREVAEVCRDGDSDPECRRAADWLASIELLERDMVEGKAYALGALDQPRRSFAPLPVAKPDLPPVEIATSTPESDADTSLVDESMPSGAVHVVQRQTQSD
jgi:phosphoglycerol transferase MdoB-like AlkP superfamily enzyme